MRSLALLLCVYGVELTPDNWDELTEGKTVFIKFLAPWCGHCKRMKPDWDKLMTAFKAHKSTLVADVDCTAAGEPLCEKVGVQGYPTIKYGDPNGLEDYEGGRDYAELKKFADDLKPVCTPSQLDACSEEDKAMITKYEAMTVADLNAKVEEKEAEIKAAESHFESEVEKLQEKYEELEKEKSDTIAAVKKSGMGIMKSVIASKKGKGEL